MAADRPNILIVMTDQQPATAMSCTGNTWLRTPAMDSLAKNGVRFERAYCCNPVCLPSRFSLMTGRFPSELGIRHNTRRGPKPVTEHIRSRSLGRVLVDAGYEAAYGGKVHLPEGLDPQQMGFDYLTDNEREELAHVAADWIRDDRQEPWALVASFINPHDICYMAIRDSEADARERRLLEGGKIELTCLDEALTPPGGVNEEDVLEKHCPPLPPNFEPQVDEPEAVDWLMRERSFRQLARERWTATDWRRHRYAMARLTERVDRQIQEVLDALRDSGQEADTVIIFTSDHGDHDGSHRMEHKTALYEEAVRVPLIISQPGVTAPGAVEHRLVSNGLDLIPTVCDYAGVAAPDDLQGCSLRPLAEGRGVGSWRDHVAIESQIGDAIVTDEAKYARYSFGANAEQLYHRGTDPFETRNSLGVAGLEDCLEHCQSCFEKSFGSTD